MLRFKTFLYEVSTPGATGSAPSGNVPNNGVLVPVGPGYPPNNIVPTPSPNPTTPPPTAPPPPPPSPPPPPPPPAPAPPIFPSHKTLPPLPKLPPDFNKRFRGGMYEYDPRDKTWKINAW